MLPKAESAEQVRQAIAAMRFKSKGGTRPDDRRQRAGVLGTVGGGVQAARRCVAAQSRRRADQLDDHREQGRPREGARDCRGQGHRRAVARRRHACAACSRRPTRPASACSTRRAGRARFSRCSRRARNSRSPAAFPPTPNDIEMRMKQGFSVFVMNWGDAGLQGDRHRAQGCQSRDQRLSSVTGASCLTVEHVRLVRRSCWRLAGRSLATGPSRAPGLAAVSRARRPGPLLRARAAGRLERVEERRLEDAGAGPRLVVAGRRRRPRLADGGGRRARRRRCGRWPSTSRAAARSSTSSCFD